MGDIDFVAVDIADIVHKVLVALDDRLLVIDTVDLEGRTYILDKAAVLVDILDNEDMELFVDTAAVAAEAYFVDQELEAEHFAVVFLVEEQLDYFVAEEHHDFEELAGVNWLVVQTAESLEFVSLVSVLYTVDLALIVLHLEDY